MEQAFLNGVYMNGLEQVDYNGLLAIGGGVATAAISDFYLDQMATDAETNGGFMATFSNPYLRQGALAGVGLGVMALSDNMMLNQFGQGWVAYGIGAMATTFVKSYFISGLGSPNNVVNIGTPKSTVTIGNQTVKQQSLDYLDKRESPQIMQTDARLTGVGQSRARITNVQTDARLTGNNYSKVKINY